MGQIPSVNCHMPRAILRVFYDISDHSSYIELHPVICSALSDSHQWLGDLMSSLLNSGQH